MAGAACSTASRRRPRAKSASNRGQCALGPPVPNPRKLMIAGANTHSHVKEAAPLIGPVPPPREPMILGKATSSYMPDLTTTSSFHRDQKLDYEVGLERCHRPEALSADPAKAKSATMSQASLTTTKSRRATSSSPNTRSNRSTAFTSLGQELRHVLSDRPRPRHRRRVYLGQAAQAQDLVNGEIRQDGDTGDLCHGIEDLVSYCSQAMTLIRATSSPRDLRPASPSS